jgi:hypothetical protein
MKESSVADEYERLAEKTELSYEEALTLKEEIRNVQSPENSRNAAPSQAGDMSF